MIHMSNIMVCCSVLDIFYTLSMLFFFKTTVLDIFHILSMFFFFKITVLHASIKCICNGCYTCVLGLEIVNKTATILDLTACLLSFWAKQRCMNLFTELHDLCLYWITFSANQGCMNLPTELQDLCLYLTTSGYPC